MLDFIDCIKLAIESKVTAFLDAHGTPASDKGFVVVLGATNGLEAVSDALFQRFHDNILLGTRKGKKILSILTRDLKLPDRQVMVKSAHDFVGANLYAAIYNLMDVVIQ